MILSKSCCIASVWVVALFALLSSSTSHARTVQQPSFNLPKPVPSTVNNHVLELRGGASKQRKRGGRSASLTSLNAKNSKKKKTASGATSVKKDDQEKSAIGDTMRKYKAILPLTRIYITMVAVSTLLGTILGDEAAQAILGLDPIRFLYGLEVWRPITAACFLGPPSIGWLMSAYYLFEYGSSLERVYGTAQQLIFLIAQVVLLTMTSILFGQPFFGPSVITAMLHVLSRSMPHQKVKWLIFTVPYWALPYGLMASDVLQGGAAAALPHVVGILSGHFYYFHKFVWPKMGGQDWLVAPNFLVRRLEGGNDDLGRKSVESALKNRKKGKGRKLSG
jgi:membrane associated rhomboid family serine protease